MNKPSSPVTSPNGATDEPEIRQRLADHPWPQFGAPLAERLAKVAETAMPEESSAAGTSDLPTPRVQKSPPQPASPRSAVPRRAWAGLALVGVVLVVAWLALADPLFRPETAPAQDTDVAPVGTPAADALPEGLAGQLLYVRGDASSGGSIVQALDVRTGRSTRLWDLPTMDPQVNVFAWQAWALSPDGTRLALTNERYGDGWNGGYVELRDLVSPDANPVTIPVAGFPHGIQWSGDGRAIYYGVIDWAGRAPNAPEEELSRPTKGFQLRRVDLDGFLPDATSGAADGMPVPASLPPDADQLLVQLSAAEIDGQFPTLEAIDEASHHAALSLNTGEANPYAVLLLDLETGTILHRIEAGDDSFSEAAAPDGSTLAYADCTGPEMTDSGCDEHVAVLNLATGRVTRALERHPGRLMWTRDGQKLFFTLSDGLWSWSSAAEAQLLATGRPTAAAPARYSTGDEGPTPSAPPSGSDIGEVIATSPDGSLLLTLDGTLWSLPGEPVGALAIPEGLHPASFVGWVPDLEPRRIAVAPDGTPAPSSTAGSDATTITPVVVATPQPGTPFPPGGPRLEPATWAPAGWSPDGQWIGVWAAGGQDHYEPYNWPARLHLVRAETGVACEQPGVASTNHSDAVFWLPEHRVAIRTEGRVVSGRPCEPLAPDPQSTFALPIPSPGTTPEWAIPPPHEWGDSAGPEDTELSPSGELEVTTMAIGEAGDFVTRVRTAAEGTVVAEVSWWVEPALGDMGTGGEWLDGDQFLIHSTDDRGPLLIQPDGRVVELATERFGQEANPTTPTAQGVRPDLGHALAAPDSRHIIFTRNGAPRMIYHPESDSVESLPTQGRVLWTPISFSPNGEWMIIRDLQRNGSTEPGLWMRPLEDQEAAFVPLPGQWQQETDYDFEPTPDWSRYAILRNQGRSVEVYAFPSLQPMGRWSTGQYDISYASWSPNGMHLAVFGHHDDPATHSTLSQALFVLNVESGAHFNSEP